MSESDTEYDAYYHPLDPEELAAIDAATARALSHRDPDPPAHVPELESSHAPASAVAPRSPPSPDEFDEYDFSEFTAEDFAHIDALVAAASPAPSPSPQPRPAAEESEAPAPQPAGVVAVHTKSPESGRGRGAAGPSHPNTYGNGRGGSRNEHGARGGPQIEITVERAASADSSRSLKDVKRGPGRKAYPKRSPYEQFRSWNRLLSVTDLVGPSWYVGLPLHSNDN